MRRVLATSVLVVAGLFVTACSDQHSPLPTEPPLSPSLTGRSCTSPLQLAALTVALFAPGDLLTFARSTQSTINLKMSRGDIAGARKLALAFVDFTLKSYYQGKLRDPNGDKPPTTAEAAVTLIDGVLCWVGLPPSGLDLTKKADITVTTEVIGKDGGELVAGDKLSGLKVEQGTVSEDALWVITRRDDLAKNGTCVSTTLTQIPLCIDFSVVPAQQVAKPVLVVICQPEDRHPLNRRLAHKLPDNKVELLAVQPDPFSVGVDRSGLDCTTTPGFEPSGLSSIGKAVWQFGSLVMRVLGPKRLHAGHSGLGGLLGPKLSPVTAVQVRLSFDVQPSNTAPSSAITPAIQVALRDLGTGALATEITNRIKVGIGTNPGGATLGSDTIQSPSNGIATFANLTINNAGTGYTLVADALSSSFTGDSLIQIPATSEAFNVARSAVLYGVNSADDGLSRYDVATGAATFIGRLHASPDSFTTPVAMAVRPSDGAVFVWNNSPQATLLTVNVCTGVASHVSATVPNSGVFGALAFSPTGALYATGGQGGIDTLFQIDPATGARMTNISLSRNTTIFGADFVSRTLFVVTSIDSLATLNTATGVLTVLGILSPNPGTPGSIVYDAGTDKLIGSAFGGQLGDVIFDINRTNATITNIRTVTGGFAPQGMGFAPACTASP